MGFSRVMDLHSRFIDSLDDNVGFCESFFDIATAVIVKRFGRDIQPVSVSVDLRSAFLHGFLDRHNKGEGLVFNLDQF